MDQNWRATTVNLGKHGDTQCARAGFVNDDGIVALPPTAAKRFGTWAEKMKISPQAVENYLKSKGG